MTAEVSLLGLGAMGEPMARALRRAGFPLAVWNRSAGKAEALAAEIGIELAGTPAEAARHIVLTVLPDLPDVRQVLEGPEGLVAGWRGAAASPILVVMGTVSPVAMRELAEEMASHGVQVVDAPVSGGVQGAREARLSIMVGAEPETFEELLPVFRAMGAVVRRLGPVGSGQLAKACNQLIVAATVVAVSEAMLLARASGLDVGELRDLLLGGLAESEVLRQKGDNWVTETFIAGGTADYQLKDLGFALAAAEAGGITLPVSTTVRELFRQLVEQGDGGLDHTGVYRALERLAAPGARP